MESEEVNQLEYEQENCEGFLGLLDSKVAQPLVRMFLQVLPNLQLALSLPLKDGLSFYTLFWAIQG